MILLILRVVFDSGFPSWSEISASIGRIYRAAQKAWAELKPLFKDSLDIETYSVIEGLLGPEPSLMKALFGADDMVRDEVDKGTHRKLPPEGRAKFINIMLDGYCGDDDEDRILTILHFSKSKGDLRSVVNQVEGQGDRIVWKLDGSQDTEVCELFDNNGIDY